MYVWELRMVDAMYYVVCILGKQVHVVYSCYCYLLVDIINNRLYFVSFY